jgi:hypothetical protein
MSDRMVLLAIFGNTVEAELARAQLEGAGIRAVVMGATSGDLFAGLGVGVSNVQLLVPEEDLGRAAELLDAREEEDDDPGEDEDSTAIKGQGGRKRSSPHVRLPRETPLESGTSPPGPSPPAAADLPPEEELPPEEDDEREERSVTWTADDIAARALRSAIFGFLICPGALHLYALWLVIRLSWAEGELSPAGWRKAVVAMALALPTSAVFLLILGGLLRLLVMR